MSAKRNLIEQRKLGTNGPQVSALGLGCMGMTGVYGQPADKQAMKPLILDAYERLDSLPG